MQTPRRQPVIPFARSIWIKRNSVPLLEGRAHRAWLPGEGAGLFRRRLLREWRGREGRVQFLQIAGVDFESGKARQFLRRFHLALVSGTVRNRLDGEVFGAAQDFAVLVAVAWNPISFAGISGPSGGSSKSMMR